MRMQWRWNSVAGAHRLRAQQDDTRYQRAPAIDRKLGTVKYVGKAFNASASSELVLNDDSTATMKSTGAAMITPSRVEMAMRWGDTLYCIAYKNTPMVAGSEQ